MYLSLKYSIRGLFETLVSIYQIGYLKELAFSFKKTKL